MLVHHSLLVYVLLSNPSLGLSVPYLGKGGTPVMHQRIHGPFINCTSLVSIEKTNSLKPYNIGMPIGDTGSHFVSFSSEFLLVLIFLPFVVDKEWYTLLCNYFLMKLGLCCQVQERLKY